MLYREEYARPVLVYVGCLKQFFDEADIESLPVTAAVAQEAWWHGVGVELARWTELLAMHA